jgi:hypothetical protein
VFHEAWSASGAHSSGEYLRRLFQDDGSVLEFSDSKAQADAMLDNEEESDMGDEGGNIKRHKLNLLKCKQCRDARKKVRCATTYGNMS